jgi:hypothetical protein
MTRDTLTCVSHVNYVTRASHLIRQLCMKMKRACARVARWGKTARDKTFPNTTCYKLRGIRAVTM